MVRTSVVLAVLFGLALPMTAQAQAPAPASEPPTLTVTGRASVQVRPDLAIVGVEVRRVDVSQESARSSVNRRTAQILAALARLGIDRDEIQTSGIGLTQQRLRPRRRGGPRRIRYVAVNELTVRTRRLDAIGRLLDAATRAGATDFRGPVFTIETRTPGRADATSAAVVDARRRADAAAAALGMRVVGVRSVALDPQSGVGSVDDGGTLPAGGQAESEEVAPTPVEPGLEEVTARVQVVFVLAS